MARLKMWNKIIDLHDFTCGDQHNYNNRESEKYAGNRIFKRQFKDTIAAS